MPTVTWKNGKAYLPKLEVHINNTCNLTCDNCDRFSNHNFTGVQKYKDYAETIEQWADKISVGHCVILGGEPLLNPTILEWVDGLRQFSDSLQILTNGTRLNQVKGLYEKIQGTGNFIGISWHNINDTSIFDEIKKFLGTNLVLDHNDEPIDQIPWPEYGNDTWIRNKEGQIVSIHLQNEFGLAAIQQNEKGKWSLWNNDPDEVHRSCSYYQHKSYNMVHGEIFKCAPVALISEFDNQHSLDISNDDREIVHSYKPLKVQNFDHEAKDFFSNIDNVLPNCKFCPASWENDPRIIYPIIKNKKLA